MKDFDRLLDDILYEHSMNYYALEGASKLLRLIIEDADNKMLKQEPFNCIEGIQCFLDKICDDMKRTEQSHEVLLKLRSEANKHD